MLCAGNVAYAHMCADVQVFIDSKYKLAYNGRYTTDEEITGMLIAVLFAGQHTSSVTCTWTLLSMLANQVRGLTLQHLMCAQQLPHAMPTTLLWATSATNCTCAVQIWQPLSELARMSLQYDMSARRVNVCPHSNRLPNKQHLML